MRWERIGGLLIVFSFVQVSMIDVVASYMLTPTPPQNPIAPEKYSVSVKAA